jgi:iron complex outermembrane recepter protein
MSHSKAIIRACRFLCLPVFLLATNPVVFAQSTADPSPTPPAPPPAADDDVKEVVIIGSRIRRTTFESPAPIKVITREEVTAAGFNSTTELLQSTATTSGSSQINNAYGNYVTDGGPGANTVSLRGLGASRTLVLINGRRLAPAGTRGAVGSVDLNVLPNAMVERVEVLRDGASSVYGSDAIGGVVNVITMEQVEGITLEGDVSIPTEGEGEETRFSISGGKSDDGWRMSGSFDYYDRKELALKDRGWTRCAIDGLRDPETGESYDYIDPKTGKPKCATISGTGTSGVTINTIGLQTITADNWEELGLSGPVVGAPGSEGTTFTRFRPNAAIATGLVGFEGVGGGDNSLNVRDTFEPRMLNESLISPAKVYTGFLQGSVDLDSLGGAQAYFEVLASRRESDQVGYRQLIMDYREGSPAIPANLAFSTVLPDQGTSDGENVGVRAFVGFGNDHNEQSVDYYKPTIGIRGDLNFLPDWKYDAYASYAKSDAEYRMESFFTDKLTYASDVVVAPSGLDSSLVQDGLTCRINLTNPGERCIAFPMLTAAIIGGDLPQNFRDYIWRDVVGTTKYEETIFSAAIDGPLVELNAGKVQGVLGLEYREAKINDQPDQNSVNSNLYNLTSAAPTKGKDSVSEIYTEVEVPLLAKTSDVGELTFNGSFRYTDYDSYGSDDTYKVGLVYSPGSWVTLRATKGTSFRAPALFEQFQGATSGFLGSNGDPCNDYGEAENPNRAANCALELPGQPDFQATNGIETLNQGGAAAGLKAETSDNETIGIIFQPDLGDYGQLSLALDYFKIQIDNGVTQAGAANILSECYDDPDDFKNETGLCRLVSRDPATKQLLVTDVFTNLATQITRGVDFDGRYELPVGPGDLVVDVSTTHYLQQDTKLFEGDDFEKLNNTITYPEWTGTLDVAYRWDQWRLKYGLQWVGKMNSYVYQEEDQATSVFDLIAGNYLEHMVSARYQTEKWEATLGVRNLTNEVPPTISALIYDRVGNAPLYSAYDYVGRTVFLNVQWRL